VGETSVAVKLYWVDQGIWKPQDSVDIIITKIAPPSPPTLTISLNKENCNRGDQIIVSGEADPNSVVNLQLSDPVGNLVAIAQRIADSSGTYYLQWYQIKTSDPLGTWTVFTSQGARAVTVTFQVSRVSTPLTVAVDKAEYYLGDLISISGVSTPNNYVTIQVYDPEGNMLQILQPKTDSGGVYSSSLTISSYAKVGVYIVTTYYEDQSIQTTFTVKVETRSLPIEVEPSIQTVGGTPITETQVGESILLVASMCNTATVDKDMIYICQVKDGSGSVVYLAFIKGSVPAGKTFDFGVSWTPNFLGDYSIEVFVWRSWADPTPLSIPITAIITVTS